MIGTSRSRSEEVILEPGITKTLNGERWPGTSSDFSATDAESFQISSSDTTLSRQIDDVVTPNFRKRIAQGEVINNPMESSEITYTPPKHTAYHRATVGETNGNYWGSEHTGEHVVPASFFPALLDFATHYPDRYAVLEARIPQVVTEAHANASSSKISALVTAAEAQKTVTSISAILWRVMRIARAAKKLDLKYIRNELSFDELQDRYMELRYAIRPLVFDAAQLVDAVQESKVFKQVRSTARGFATVSDTVSDSAHVVDSNNDLEYDQKRTVTFNANIRAGVLCEVQTSLPSVWGLDQPLEAVWELIPFSFIVDWFVNIGDTIAAWTPNAGIRERASWVSVEYRQTSLANVDSFKNITNYNVRNEFTWSGQIKQTTVHKTRTVNPKLSVYPSVKLRLNNLKLLDLAAIGRNVFK